MTGTIDRVVVVGRDAALWLSAAAIARALGPTGVTVDAIELDGGTGTKTSYLSLPPLEAFHNKLGIGEPALLASGAAFSLGHNFSEPGGRSRAFFHAWSAYGTAIEGTAFLPHWLKARRSGLSAELQDFCPAAVAAKNGRMILPDGETDAFGRLDYAYHLPADHYVALLRSRALRHGVQPHQAAAVAVAHAATGDVEAVTIDGCHRVDGDFFVDASGTEAVLFDATASDTHETWRLAFPADRVLTARGPALSALPAYSEQRAWTGGWTRLQPDRSGTGVVQAFCSAITGEDEALATVVRTAGLPLGDVVISPSAPKRRRVPWDRNRVAIGGAAATFDPIHGVDLHGVQLGIVHLLALLPRSRAHLAAQRDEYNRLIGSLFDRIRDFQASTYLLANWQGPFWDAARRSEASAQLDHLIATFRARGEIAPLEDETFQADSWKAMLVGLGVLPETWPPGIDMVPPERLKGEFRRILAFIAEKVRQQPTHDSYLAASSRSAAA